MAAEPLVSAVSVYSLADLQGKTVPECGRNTFIYHVDASCRGNEYNVLCGECSQFTRSGNHST